MAYKILKMCLICNMFLLHGLGRHTDSNRKGMNHYGETFEDSDD